MKIYVLTYRTKIMDSSLQIKSVKDHKIYFDTISELTDFYKRAKETTFMGITKTNFDFKIYNAVLTEMDKTKIDELIN